MVNYVHVEIASFFQKIFHRADCLCGNTKSRFSALALFRLVKQFKLVENTFVIKVACIDSASAVVPYHIVQSVAVEGGVDYRVHIFEITLVGQNLQRAEHNRLLEKRRARIFLIVGISVVRHYFAENVATDCKTHFLVELTAGLDAVQRVFKHFQSFRVESLFKILPAQQPPCIGNVIFCFVYSAFHYMAERRMPHVVQKSRRPQRLDKYEINNTVFFFQVVRYETAVRIPYRDVKQIFPIGRIHVSVVTKTDVLVNNHRLYDVGNLFLDKAFLNFLHFLAEF